MSSWREILGARKLWLLMGAAFLLLLAIALARAQYRQISDSLFVCDGFGYYIYLPSLIIDGDLDLSNQLAYQAGQPNLWVYEFVEITQRPGNCFQCGCAMLWSPFFLAAHSAIQILNGAGATIRQDGFGLPYELPVYVGSFAYGMLGLIYTWRLLTSFYGERVASIATFYTAVGTALAAYLWFEPDMSHVPSMFLIAALLFYLHEIYRQQSLSWKHWARIGALIGLIVAVRATDVWVVIGAISVGLAVCRSNTCFTWKRAICCVVSCGSVAFVCFLPQMLVWKALYGGYLTRPPGVYHEFNWLSPDLFGLFFGTRRGIFIWTPLLLLSILGLIVALYRGPIFLRLVVPIVLVALYFDATIPRWWAGCSFGERRMVDYSVIFALGLGQFLSLHPKLSTSWYVHTFGLFLCGFNWLLMLRYFTLDLPEYGYVSLENLYLETFAFPVRVLLRLVM